VDALNGLFRYHRTMSTSPITVLVIENHPLMREALCAAIAAEPGLALVEPSSGKAEAFQLVLSSEHDVIWLACRPDIVLLSLGNPGRVDLEALAALRCSLPGTPVLALTCQFDLHGRQRLPRSGNGSLHQR
jgi:DNA-binding NarL/FixJ family response regulator